MPGMDEFICIPTENIPMNDRNKENEKSIAPKSIDKWVWGWDKNIDDFKTLVKNLHNEKSHSRADIVEYLIERCRRSESEIEGYKHREEIFRRG